MEFKKSVWKRSLKINDNNIWVFWSLAAQFFSTHLPFASFSRWAGSFHLILLTTHLLSLAFMFLSCPPGHCLNYTQFVFFVLDQSVLMSYHPEPLGALKVVCCLFNVSLYLQAVRIIDRNLCLKHREQTNKYSIIWKSQHHNDTQALGSVSTEHVHHKVLYACSVAHCPSVP